MNQRLLFTLLLALALLPALLLTFRFCQEKWALAEERSALFATRESAETLALRVKRNRDYHLRMLELENQSLKPLRFQESKGENYPLFSESELTLSQTLATKEWPPLLDKIEQGPFLICDLVLEAGKEECINVRMKLIKRTFK